jgi:hypothetical protein
MTKRREIGLGDVPAKATLSELRHRIAKATTNTVVESQCAGGYHGAGCDVAHVTARAAYNIAAARNQSLGLLFIDVATAFSVILRGLTVPLPETETEAAHTLRALGFSGDECCDVMNEAYRRREWAEAEPHVQHLAAAYHKSIWTGFDYKTGIVATKIGTIAGMPLADVIFIIAASRVTKRIRTELQAEGLIEQLATKRCLRVFRKTTKTRRKSIRRGKH